MKNKIFKPALYIAILSGVLLLASSAKSGNGISSSIPAYYDGKIFTIQFVEFTASESTLLNNPGLNFIYQCPNFISVIDAIPTDGMNPIWEEVDISFNPGFTPHQFVKDDDVLAAASGSNPEITLTFTGEVYKCPIIGHK